MSAGAGNVPDLQGADIEGNKAVFKVQNRIYNYLTTVNIKEIYRDKILTHKENDHAVSLSTDVVVLFLELVRILFFVI